jgi:hypothetical protein
MYWMDIRIDQIHTGASPIVSAHPILKSFGHVCNRLNQVPTVRRSSPAGYGDGSRKLAFE